MEKFWSRVDRAGDCWEWQAGKNGDGYGAIRINRKYFLAHRLSYELAYGPIPTGLCVCHRCDNPACVRPDHLFLGTQADNVRDMQTKGRNKGGPPTGEGNHSAKLTAKQVKEIRLLYERSRTPHRQIAERYGMSKTAISQIIQRKTWRHVQ